MGRLCLNLEHCVGSLSGKKTCDVVAALAKAGHKERTLMHAVEGVVATRPFKFHAEHFISLLRDFSKLGLYSPGMKNLLLEREAELSECTPSALCSLPSALAGHATPQAGITGVLSTVGPDEAEEELTRAASKLLCEEGHYRLPSDARVFRPKDDFWWQQLRQRHFRLKRRAAAQGKEVSTARVAELDQEADELSMMSTAITHVSREECLQLVTGCASLRWRDSDLLTGITRWFCIGRRHAELEASEVSRLLGAFCSLN